MSNYFANMMIHYKMLTYFFMFFIFKLKSKFLNFNITGRYLEQAHKLRNQLPY